MPNTPHTAADALRRLIEGNRAFVTGLHAGEPLSRTEFLDLSREQRPFAIVLGCSDARVPAEIVFNQGLGDLFVIRVAGNVVAPSQVGSVEFAASRYACKLVVVMGHSSCGAVLATIDALNNPGSRESRNLQSIVNRVRPSVESLMRTELAHDHEALVHHAVRANVAASVDHLRHGSELLERLIASEGLVVVGAEYSLATGEVDFFDRGGLDID
jgi:carbonic anhydrase